MVWIDTKKQRYDVCRFLLVDGPLVFVNYGPRGYRIPLFGCIV